MDTSKKKPFYRTITVEPVLFFFTFVDFARRGLSDDIIYHKVCEQGHNSTICDTLQNFTSIENDVQTQSSFWIMGGNISIFIPALICVMYLGSWSDKFGSKIPMLFPPVCGAINISIYVFASAFPIVPIWMILFSNVILGLSGSTSTCSMTSSAYVSVTSPESERSVRISRLVAMSTLGAAGGPFVTAAVIDSIGRTYTLVMFLGIHVTNVLYICFFIKNIKPDRSVVQRSAGKCCSRYFSLRHVKEGFVTALRKRENGDRKAILLILLEYSIIIFVLIGEISILYLYAVDHPFYWRYSTFSYYTAFKHSLNVLTLLVVIPLLKRYGITDNTLCTVSVLSIIFELILLGLSYNSIMMFIAPLLALFSNAAVAMTRSMVSLIVGKSEQGKMFSVFAICHNMSNIFAALIYNSVYPITRSVFNGLLFEISAVVMVIPLAINWWMNRRNKNVAVDEDKEEEKVELQNIVKQ